MWRHISNLKKLTVKTIDKYIWGFMFFREGREVFEWVTFQGLVITQLDTNLVSAIIGMYFGGSLVKK